MTLVGPELVSVFGDEIRHESLGPARVAALPATISWAAYFVGCAVTLALCGGRVQPLPGFAELLYGATGGTGVTFFFASFLLMVSVTAAAMGWFSAASRLLWRFAREGWIPTSIGKISGSAPSRAIMAQGFLSSFVLLLGLSADTNRYYQHLLQATLVLQLVPFLVLFLALAFGQESARRSLRVRLAGRWERSVAQLALVRR